MRSILIIEPQVIIRIGFVSLVAEIMPSTRVIECDSLAEALPILSIEQIDCVILDIKQKNTTRHQSVAKIRREIIGPKLLVYSELDENKFALHSIQMGADGFLSKGALRAEHIQALLAMANNERYLSARLHQQLISHFMVATSDSPGFNQKLTQEETDVARLLMKGMTPTEIAEWLDLDQMEVMSLGDSLYAKTGARETIEKVHELNKR